MSYINFRDTLINLAKDSIKHGLESGEALNPETNDFADELNVTRATFVTLKINGQLRGCIGSLNAYQSLIDDIAHNAYAAAFSDPRFPALSEHEYPNLEIHISILSPSEPIEFSSEEDLISKIKPGVDGLIIEADGRRGTFLPTVWESLPEPRDFFTHLKQKAGLPPDYWSDNIKMWRYSTELIS